MKSFIHMKQRSNISISLMVLSLLMIGFSIYLTKHFFDLKFPTGLVGKSLCNVNQFFNCDKTTHSKLSNLFGIPISSFGVLIGIITFFGQFIKNKNYECTTYFTLIVNFLGCVFLFSYSLLILKGLCPFCTLYYIASGLALFLFYKNNSTIKPIPSLNFLLLFTVMALGTSGLTKMYIISKTAAQSSKNSDIIKQFYSLTNSGNPKINSEFKISDVSDAPIKLVIFSDFECPTCKVFSEMIPKFADRYQGKIDIEYFYYPVDMSCNPYVKRTIHPNACKAAYAASCMPSQDFSATHDNFFLNQEKFEKGFLEQFIKTHHIEKCVADPKTKAKVLSLVEAAGPYDLNVTPTFLINGVKIEGVIPIEPMLAIFDEIITRAQN